MTTHTRHELEPIAVTQPIAADAPMTVALPMVVRWSAMVAPVHCGRALARAGLHAADSRPGELDREQAESGVIEVVLVVRIDASSLSDLRPGVHQVIAAATLEAGGRAHAILDRTPVDASIVCDAHRSLAHVEMSESRHRRLLLSMTIATPCEGSPEKRLLYARTPLLEQTGLGNGAFDPPQLAGAPSAGR